MVMGDPTIARATVRALFATLIQNLARPPSSVEGLGLSRLLTS